MLFLSGEIVVQHTVYFFDLFLYIIVYSIHIYQLDF
ncbi:hypothetical protein Chro_0962 [Chroococcidiopsis thermalis PCC 7203]|uniref:Uncharacterized protein n=1 Tax=Chroococcidiopsis thermalis (strain PCC 7203) TaxID=251229 RepID=K9TWD4_CHRTP|nr:hypothetical protein Chro_0962 [Chroococcidiopsis thermalis PCC 7203]